jgi:hypothetical protein
VDRKRHNAIVTAKWAAQAAVCRLVDENNKYSWSKLKVAKLKAILRFVHADTPGSKQALVDRCLDEDVALKINEQVLAEAAKEGNREGEMGEEGVADSKDGEETTPKLAFDLVGAA